MKRFIVWENEKGWLVYHQYDDGDSYFTHTDILKEATEFPFRKAIEYLRKDRYVIESSLYQDT